MEEFVSDSISLAERLSQLLDCSEEERETESHRIRGQHGRNALHKALINYHLIPTIQIAAVRLTDFGDAEAEADRWVLKFRDEQSRYWEQAITMLLKGRVSPLQPETLEGALARGREAHLKHSDTECCYLVDANGHA